MSGTPRSLVTSALDALWLPLEMCLISVFSRMGPRVSPVGFILAIPGECSTRVSRKLCDSTVSRSRRLRINVSSAMSLPAAHGGAPGDQVD